MGQRNERVIGLDADHREICKFGSNANSNYQRVLKRLEAEATEIEEQSTIGGESSGLLT